MNKINDFDECLIEDVEYFVEKLNEESKTIIEKMFPLTKDFWVRMYQAQELFKNDWENSDKDECILNDVLEFFNDPNGLFKYYFEEVMQ